MTQNKKGEEHVSKEVSEKTTATTTTTTTDKNEDTSTTNDTGANQPLGGKGGGGVGMMKNRRISTSFKNMMVGVGDKNKWKGRRGSLFSPTTTTSKKQEQEGSEGASTEVGASTGAGGGGDQDEKKGGGKQQGGGGQRNASTSPRKRFSLTAKDLSASLLGSKHNQSSFGGGGGDLHGRALGLAKKGEWDELLDCLAEVDDDDEEAAAASAFLGCSSSGGAGDTVMHAACRHGLVVPIQVVRRIADVFPLTVRKLDVDGQTVLHVAASRGATVAVVQFLLKRYSEAVRMKDDRGQTPLILACKHWSRFDKDDGADDATGVVEVLCRASPASVDVEDDMDMTALEYAIVRGAPESVVEMIHRTLELL